MTMSMSMTMTMSMTMSFDVAPWPCLDDFVFHKTAAVVRIQSQSVTLAFPVKGAKSKNKPAKAAAWP